MGIAAMIRRCRQQDAVEAALKAYDDMRLERNQWFEGCQSAQKRAEANAARCSELETEILRLRKNALTPTPERVDNSVVKAKSTADVRRLTEAAFGKELQEAFERKGEVHDS